MSSHTTAPARRALVAVSLKMYLTAAETREWVRGVRTVVEESGTAAVEVAVLPSFPVLESTAATLADSGVRWGAQDVAPGSDGAQTGEVSAAMLAELGCTYVELAHAERRALFGEDDRLVQAKLDEALGAGLAPLYCVGEEEQGSAAEAAERCVNELEPIFEATRGRSPALVVAYEPRWAIGAEEPAPADHVRRVCAAIRDAACDDAVRVVYGGSAGPGTFTALYPDVDGVFLGRFAHDIQKFAAVLDEVSACTTTNP